MKDREAKQAALGQRAVALMNATVALLTKDGHKVSWAGSQSCADAGPWGNSPFGLDGEKLILRIYATDHDYLDLTVSSEAYFKRGRVVRWTQDTKKSPVTPAKWAKKLLSVLQGIRTEVEIVRVENEVRHKRGEAFDSLYHELRELGFTGNNLAGPLSWGDDKDGVYTYGLTLPGLTREQVLTVARALKGLPQ